MDDENNDDVTVAGGGGGSDDDASGARVGICFLFMRYIVFFSTLL
jgi:hypothetical protein